MLCVIAAVRKATLDVAERAQLGDFGKYVAECMPKYVQKVQFTLLVDIKDISYHVYVSQRQCAKPHWM